MEPGNLRSFVLFVAGWTAFAAFKDMRRRYGWGAAFVGWLVTAHVVLTAVL